MNRKDRRRSERKSNKQNSTVIPQHQPDVVPTPTYPDNIPLTGIEYRSGPLPDPSELEEYNRLIPGFAEKLSNDFFANTQHGRNMEKRIVNYDLLNRLSKRALALVALLLIIGAGIYFMIKGHATEGAWIIGVSLVGVIGVIITERANPPSKQNNQDA